MNMLLKGGYRPRYWEGCPYLPNAKQGMPTQSHMLEMALYCFTCVIAALYLFHNECTLTFVNDYLDIQTYKNQEIRSAKVIPNTPFKCFKKSSTYPECNFI